MTRMKFLGITGRGPSIGALEEWTLYTVWLMDPLPWPNPFEPLREAFEYVAY